MQCFLLTTALGLAVGLVLSGCAADTQPTPAAPVTTFAPPGADVITPVSTPWAPGGTPADPAVAGSPGAAGSPEPAGSPAAGLPPAGAIGSASPIPPAVIEATATTAGGPAASDRRTPPPSGTPPSGVAPAGTAAPATATATPAGERPADPATATPIPPTPTPWLPQTRDVGDVRVSLLQFDQGLTPDGRPIVRLRAQFENRGDRAAFFADLYFQLVDADGRRYEPEVNVDSPDRLHQGPLPPGQSTTGYLWYLVPPNTRVVEVLYDGPTGQTSFPVPSAQR